MTLRCLSNYLVKRASHNAPDYDLLKKSLEKSSYRSNSAVGLDCLNKYPQLTERYLKTTAVMNLKGNVVFVHSQDILFRVARVFIQTLKNEKKCALKRLKEPTVELSRGVLLEEIEQSRRNNIDSSVDGVGEYLLSVSYSLFNFTQGESSFDFLFCKPWAARNERSLESVINLISDALEKEGLENKIEPVLSSLQSLFEEYSKLERGSLFVVGVPINKVESFAYDSRPFGRPTYQNVLGSQGLDLGAQARILVCKETLHLDSGIEVVNIEDPQEVSDFCSGFPLKPPSAIYKPFGLFSKIETEIEECYEEKLRELDAQVRKIALEAEYLC